jgi:hypothetical protein
MMYALIVISCVWGDPCVAQKTYYPSEWECGAAADEVRRRLAEELPPAKVTYFCQEQESF